MVLSAEEIAHLLHGTVSGDPRVNVGSFCRIDDGQAGALTFLANPKYAHFLPTTLASVVIVSEKLASKTSSATQIIVPDAYTALAQLLSMYEQATRVKRQGIHPTAVIESGASVSATAYVGAHCHIEAGAVVADGSELISQVYVGRNAKIGSDCMLHPGVKILHGTHVGNRCIIQAGAVIGSDGFGFAPSGGQYAKVPQVGHVILEDDVEIGANTTIDRGSIGPTIIRKGTKLDNLVQIAHNVDIGAHSVMAAQSGVAGSTKIGQGAMIGGQVGIVGHLQIGENVKIAAQSGIGSNLSDSAIVQGSPAFDASLYRRCYVLFRKLPDLARQLDVLQNRQLKPNDHAQ